MQIVPSPRSSQTDTRMHTVYEYVREIHAYLPGTHTHTQALSVCGHTRPSQAALLHYTPGRLPDDYHCKPHHHSHQHQPLENLSSSRVKGKNAVNSMVALVAAAVMITATPLMSNFFSTALHERSSWPDKAEHKPDM